MAEPQRVEPKRVRPEEMKVPVEKAPPIDLARIRPVVRERVRSQEQLMDQMFSPFLNAIDKHLMASSDFAQRRDWKESELKRALA